MKKKVLTSWTLIVMLLSISVAWAQDTRTVTGRVTTGADRSPLPGVNVVLRGTTIGTFTDADGRYSIQVPTTGGTLVFSFIGMQNQEIAVGTQTTINVQLAEDARALGEVVVTALGEVRERRALGFSVTEVQTAEINQARAPNLVNALAGKVAGVRVQGASGMTGAGANIFIRGFTTFTGTNQPLFVVDGIPIDNAGGARPAGVGGTTSGGAAALQQGVTPSNRGLDLNPDDIESISVLKGPAAAVLYGSRAAAGAIIITTKRGAARADRRQTINFTSSYQASEVNRFPDYQNEFGQGNRGDFNSEAITSWGPRATGQTVTNFRGEQEPLTINPDNVRDIFRTGHQFMNNISFSGGTDRSNYFLSYGNLNDRGILDNNVLNRHTLTFNGGSQLTEKLRSSVSVIYSNNQSQRTQQGNQLANPFFRTWFLPRSYDVTRYPFETPQGLQQRPTGTGAARYNPNNTWYGVDDNPLWTIKHNTYNDAINRVIGNISFGYDFTDWLTFDYRIGTDAYTEEIKRVNQRTSAGGAAVGGVGAISNEVTNRRETSSYANLTFNRRLGENLGLRLLVGNEINERRLNYTAVTGNNIQIPGFDNITNTLNYQPFESTIINRLVGFYADAQLDYRNFLFLGLTGRNDHSSTFGPARRSYFYPSVTTSFVFTDALPNLQNNVLTFGKIRANIAQVGREAQAFQTDTYFGRPDPFDSFLGANAFLFPFQGQLGQTFDNTGGNPDLGPEFTTTYEVGTELRLFNGRMMVDLGYFNQRSRDIIFAVPVASASGFTNQIQNIGKSESQGIELLVGGTPLQAGRFSWESSFNWTRIRNTVLELAPGVEQITLGGFVTPSTRLIAGQPYGVIFGSVFRRHENGQLLLDVNGRPSLALDNQIIGDPNPKWTGGFTNTFTFGGLSLTTLLDLRYGGDLISRNVSDLRRSGAVIETADRGRLYLHDGVFADGTRNNILIPAQDYFDDLYGFGRAEFVIFDASWVRLREAALTYRLPQNLLQNTFLGQVELGVNGRNLFLYAPNVPHIDPEVNAQGVSNSQGLEFNSLPQVRNFGGMVRITF